MVPPATPPGPPITRTFAARDDLVEWTRKVASDPPPSPAAGVSHHDRDLRASTGSSASDDAEPATRALPASAPPQRSKVRGLSLYIAGAAALGAIGLIAGARDRPLVDGPSTAASVPATAPLALAPSAPAVAPSVSPPTSPPASVSAPPPPRASTNAVRGVPSIAASEPSTAGLKLTADPPATVTVVGAGATRTWVTPVRDVKLPPGVYSVTFRSATFEGPVSARVELQPGVLRGVHADFRAAVPRVIVR
jgi:hypothetical protein